MALQQRVSPISDRLSDQTRKGSRPSDQFRNLFEAFNLSCDGSAYRCAFSQEDVKAKHEYRVRSTHEVCDQLSMCECIQHASLNQQNATFVGEYPVRLAETWFKRIHGHMNVPENS